MMAKYFPNRYSLYTVGDNGSEDARQTPRPVIGFNRTNMPLTQRKQTTTTC